jgi:Tol biopolymer transport system component
MAYVSDASGQPETYVAPVDGGPAAHRWPISSGGGLEPRFSPDGKVLYYRSPTFDWMAVDVRLARDTVEAGTPRKLFSVPATEFPYLRNMMDVVPDGSGFLTVRPSDAQLSSSFIRVRTGR